MSTPFMGQIEIFSFNFAPKGWAQCNGQLLPINQNQALFSLLGTTFGGNGQTTFGLPDLRSRIPISMGPQNVIGTQAGTEAVTLNISTMAAHNHPLNGDATSTNVANTPATAQSVLGKASGASRRVRHSSHGQYVQQKQSRNGARPAHHQQYRRQPGAHQHPALPDAQLLHRAAGHLPVAELTARGVQAEHRLIVLPLGGRAFGPG